MPTSRPAARRTGLLLWAAQPLSILVELYGAALSTAPYSLLHNTLSDLGATTCTTIPYPAQDVAVCSPAHAVVNASFVLFGLAMAVGAVLLHPALPRGGTTTAATVLWVATGASSVGAGLTPLDRWLDLHALVSAPGIVLGGAATMLTGAALARSWRPAWWWLAVTGAVSLVAGAVLLVRLDVLWGGLLERAALWPAFAACALVAAALRRRARTQSR